MDEQHQGLTKPLNLNFKGIVAKLEHLSLLHMIHRMALQMINFTLG